MPQGIADEAPPTGAKHQMPPTGAKHQIMHRHLHLRRAVGLGPIATRSLWVLGPAGAALRGAATTLAARPAPSSATPAASHSAACSVTTDQVRFDFPLPRTARLLVSGLPIRVVALGSSSTRGAG